MIQVLHNGKAERIRLYGIDCPEKRQAFGTRAKLATSTFSFSEGVIIEKTGKGRYGRIRPTVLVSDGWNLNHELVKDGWFWWYRKCVPHDRTMGPLKQSARDDEKGFVVSINSHASMVIAESKVKDINLFGMLLI